MIRLVAELLRHYPTKARYLTLNRSRWGIGHYFQSFKDGPGLDHFEDRSWTGLNHYLALSALAHLLIIAIHARATKNFWCDAEANPRGDPAVLNEAERMLLLRQQV